MAAADAGFSTASSANGDVFWTDDEEADTMTAIALSLQSPQQAGHCPDASAAAAAAAVASALSGNLSTHPSARVSAHPHEAAAVHSSGAAVSAGEAPAAAACFGEASFNRELPLLATTWQAMQREEADWGEGSGNGSSSGVDADHAIAAALQAEEMERFAAMQRESAAARGVAEADLVALDEMVAVSLAQSWELEGRQLLQQQQRLLQTGQGMFNSSEFKERTGSASAAAASAPECGPAVHQDSMFGGSRGGGGGSSSRRWSGPSTSSSGGGGSLWSAYEQGHAYRDGSWQLNAPLMQQYVPVECPICLEEDVPLSSMIFLSGCPHGFCLSCLGGHARACVEVRRPVACPVPGCGALLSSDDCAMVLDGEQYATALRVLAELAIAEEEKFFCPYRECSALMVLEPPGAAGGGAGAAGGGGGGGERGGGTLAACGACGRAVCVACRVAWHEGTTCEEFQAAPEDERDPEDFQLKALASAAKWKRCPKCRSVVERESGCPHMTCKCGAEFCYTCGAQWSNGRATCHCHG